MATKAWTEMGILVTDPTKIINAIPSSSVNDGLWGQMQPTSITDPFEERLKELENQVELVKLEATLLRLKILSMEGKFTQEEIGNLRKMLMSEDEASKTLANTIIENA